MVWISPSDERMKLTSPAIAIRRSSTSPTGAIGWGTARTTGPICRSAAGTTSAIGWHTIVDIVQKLDGAVVHRVIPLS